MYELRQFRLSVEFPTLPGELSVLQSGFPHSRSTTKQTPKRTSVLNCLQVPQTAFTLTNCVFEGDNPPDLASHEDKFQHSNLHAQAPPRRDR